MDEKVTGELPVTETGTRVSVSLEVTPRACEVAEKPFPTMTFGEQIAEIERHASRPWW